MQHGSLVGSIHGTPGYTLVGVRRSWPVSVPDGAGFSVLSDGLSDARTNLTD